MSDLVQQTRARQGGKTIQQMLDPIRSPLGIALAERIGVDRFMQAAVTSFRANEKLQRCTEDSILGGLFVAAQLGLEVGGPRGLAYLVPYGNQATLVLGYKGVVELFYRTGQVRTVDAFLVREGDVFRKRWDPDRGRVFDWEPASDDGKPIGAVAYVITTAGGLLWEYLTEAEILQRRPAQWTNGPWRTWPDQMWLKTVLKALPRKVRMASDDQSLALAVEVDQTVQRRVPGLAQNVVGRVPVQAEIEAQKPAQGSSASDPGVDEIPDYQEQERQEFAAWQAQQEQAEQGGDT